ncbi:MAG: Ig-like domain-containing protein [Butyrivibrio sp.]|nr:Ig-like domain-containing protein [Butyrivibrio sp.]
MKRRILSWLLAISLTAGSLVPSIPAFAAEYATKSVSEASVEDSATEETSEEDEKGEPEETPGETGDEDEAGKESGSEEGTDPSENPGEAVETPAATEETTETEDPTEEVSAAEESSEAADEASEDISLIDDEQLMEAKLLGEEDSDITANEIGFLCTEDERTEEIVGPCLTVKSKRVGVNVDVYAAKKADKKNAVKIATLEKTGSKLSYYDDVLMSKETKYLIKNAIKADFASLGAGDFFLFARFYTGEGKSGYVDSKNTIKLHNPKGPEIKSIRNSKTASEEDIDHDLTPEEKEPLYGKAVFKAKEGDGYLYYGQGLPTKPADEEGTEEGENYFAATKLLPGKYVAINEAQKLEALFADEYTGQSQVTEFVIGLEAPSIKGIDVINCITGAPILESVDLPSGSTMRIRGEVMPSDVKDKAVTFKSSAPKVVSVDAGGNIKALKATGSADITVSTHEKDSAGKPVKEVSFTVNITPAVNLKIKNAAFKTNPLTATYESDGELTLELECDKDIECPVSWTINNIGVITFEDETYAYNSMVSAGTATAKVVMKKYGKATVTANIGGVKTVTCTVNVDGCADLFEEPYCHNGSYLSGVYAFKVGEKEIAASGADALKLSDGYNVIYYDPESHYPVNNQTVTIGKKMYFFNPGGTLYRGKTAKDGSKFSVLANTKGELLTGWQIADGDTEEKTRYYSPTIGYYVCDSWVKKGKGYTWVDNYGYMKDDEGYLLNKDGGHRVDGHYYLFKGGLKQFGFVYFDKDNKITTAKKAAYAMYCDPATGEVYASTSTKSGLFAVNGKPYLADEFGMVGYNKIAQDKYTGYYYYCGKAGVIEKKKFISVTFDKVNKITETYYADADGVLYADGVFLIGGKLYEFDKQCRLVANTTGHETKYYAEEDGDGDPVYFYAKAANAKKATDGEILYTDATCKTKVTSCWVFKSGDEEYGTTPARRYIDKNGKFASGMVTVDGTLFFFDPEDDNALQLGVIDKWVTFKYKGKLYLRGSHGQILNDPSKFFKASKGNYFRAKDKTGVLMTGLQTINKKKYVFTDEGVLDCPGTEGLLAINKFQIYLANKDYDNSKDSDSPEKWFVYAPGKLVLGKYFSRKAIFNKDGSMKFNGWATVDGKKYYVYMGNMPQGNIIVRIKGKYYSFDNDGVMRKGWALLSSPDIVDVETLAYEEFEYDGAAYYYFDPKTGAMATGWKTMNTLRIDSFGNVIDDVEKGVTGTKKKIYFNTATTNEYPVGALVRNMDFIVGGKLYRFNADGSAATGVEGFVSDEPGDLSVDRIRTYKKADGTLAKGRTLVKTAAGSVYMYFSLADGVKETNVVRKTGKKWYYYDSNGQSSTAVQLKHRGSDKAVTAVFNADGSIKQFVMQDRIGTVVKNDFVVDAISYEYYVLGKDGLPLTGMVTIPGMNMTMNVAGDGKGITVKTMSIPEGNYQLKKIGKKYYMLMNGVVVNKNLVTSVDLEQANYDYGSRFIVVDSFDESTFDSLSSADKAYAEKCMRYNDAIDEVLDQPLVIILNPDGSVKTGAVKTYAGTYYTNKFGIPLDLLSPFVGKGGWRISSCMGNKAGSMELEAVNAKSINPDVKRTLVFSWDENGKLLPITDKATGKKVTGIFALSKMAGVCVIIKNGKLSSGNVTLKYGPLTFKVAVDKELGIGVLPMDE